MCGPSMWWTSMLQNKVKLPCIATRFAVQNLLCMYSCARLRFQTWYCLTEDWEAETGQTQNEATATCVSSCLSHTNHRSMILSKNLPVKGHHKQQLRSSVAMVSQTILHCVPPFHHSLDKSLNFACLREEYTLYLALALHYGLFYQQK